MSDPLSAGYISATAPDADQAVTPAELSMMEIYGFDYENKPPEEEDE